jgi:hypothetical protein
MKRLNSYKIRLLLIGFFVAFVVVAGSAQPADADDFEGMRPIADAGSSRYAAIDPVVLDGTRSYDPDNSGSLTYAWRQIAGPPVIIIDANTTTPIITGSMQPGEGRDPTPMPGGFPQTDEVQECEFELVVSDGELTSLPDAVKVIIVPDFGASTLQQENPPFDPDKPTIIYFGGGDCVNGLPVDCVSPFTPAAWLSKANIINFPNGYAPDSGGNARTYYKYGDMIIVYLSAVAPDYKQPIQTVGWSTGAMPAVDVGIHLNRVYRDARYAVNRVTHLDGNPACRVMENWPPQPSPEAWDVYLDTVELFLTSSVDGEQCWIDHYYGTSGYPYEPIPRTDILWVRTGLAHGPVRNWYRNSLAGNDMNKFNSGLVAGAYWSVIGAGKNLQLASTDAYYFRWDGGEQSGRMSFYDESQCPGRLPEPVTLIGPEDGAIVDTNGAILSCEESENAVGYQLIFGHDPYHIIYLFSDTPTPPDEKVKSFPFEQTWWTVRAYDQYGSTIYPNPIHIHAGTVSAQIIENETTRQRYASIQQAINDASDGQKIVISPGIYQYLENINFKGKNLTVRSTDPNDPDVVTATVINGDQHGPVISLSGSPGASCVIDGLTIIGGTIGVSCCSASPTIRNCTIASYGPAAIEFWDGHEPIIIDCNIQGQLNQVVDSRLVAYWELDEVEGVTAYDCINHRDVTLQNGPVWQPEGE